MKASSANLLTVIKGPKQFVIPIYQRTYSWQLAQCDQLLKDIIRISKNDNLQGHFLGSIVYFQEDIHTISDVPKLLVIDGQQRLTTVSLLILALAHFLKNNPVELDTNANKLFNYYLLNSDEDNDLRYKLMLTRGDKQSYINLLNEIPQEDTMNRVTENYKFFASRINEENVKVIYNGVLRLFIVDVALEKDKDNPQLIFESMNSTGLDLSQADLIRNYVLMGQEIDLQTKLYENYWFPMEQTFGNEYSTRFDGFMRDYLSVKTGKIPRIGEVYEEFKLYINSDRSSESIVENVKDTFNFANHYSKIVLRKEKDKDLQEMFSNILKLKVDVAYPFILPVYNDYVHGLVSKDDFISILKLVESYVFRRAICGIPTNSLNKTFGNLYKSVNTENYLESVQASFQLLDSYKRFPDDTEFEKEIISKDVYNFRSRNYLLSKLENFKRKEFVNVDEYTIEHILPQNQNLSEEWQNMLGEEWQDIQKKYLHTLGNLTLTGYNSEMSDHPFARKKSIEGGFDDSPLRLNTYLRTASQWTPLEIGERAGELSQKATLIWDSPKLSSEILERYLQKDEKEIVTYDLDHFGYLEGDILELYETLKKRILNIDSSVKEEIKKLYIAFKSSTNFVDIEPQKSRLRLMLNMKFDEVNDPLNLAKDVTGLGRWGNGDVEVGISNINEIDDVMDLIQQAFDVQVGA
ncbi:GmrSD restriction endonuclease domain-containing protein [Elizabethkingia meningoseptica]|uniref:GmrSD restriction endonuclease domain-containing protein n=1 Tax=Elizabethkingia meningoseptica TaxID=238 RepID=UPI003891D841